MHGRNTDLDMVSLLPSPAMLRQDSIRCLQELSHQIHLGNWANQSGAPGALLGGHGARSPMKGKVSLQGGSTDVEQAGNIGLGHPAVDRLDNAFAKINGICFHAVIILLGLT
jgi:hypothetical protein